QRRRPPQGRAEVRGRRTRPRQPPEGEGRQQARQPEPHPQLRRRREEELVGTVRRFSGCTVPLHAAAAWPGTTRTGTVLFSSTPFATEPRTFSAAPPKPWLPTTMARACRRLASRHSTSSGWPGRLTNSASPPARRA